ncbi:MAG: BolA/IbaG family iron-sulfur metabolism protein [Myxococcota bacterium]
MSDMKAAITAAIEGAIEGARVEVGGGGGGHYELSVTSAAFAGKNTLQRHRMVLGAIKELMAGHDAPVHAIDSIRTSTD